MMAETHLSAHVSGNSSSNLSDAPAADFNCVFTML
jgi:hypothetical protein